MGYVPIIDEYKIHGILVIRQVHNVLQNAVPIPLETAFQTLVTIRNKNNTNSFTIKYKMNEKLRNIICVRYLY